MKAKLTQYPKIWNGALAPFKEWRPCEAGSLCSLGNSHAPRGYDLNHLNVVVAFSRKRRLKKRPYHNWTAERKN